MKTATLPDVLHDYRSEIDRLALIELGASLEERIAGFVQAVDLTRQLRQSDDFGPYKTLAENLADHGNEVALRLWSSLGADLMKLLARQRS